MKSIFHFMALVAILMLASCGGKNSTYEGTYFTCEIPAGTTPDSTFSGQYLENVTFLDSVKDLAYGVIVFPFPADAKAMLQAQTVGGMNPGLAGMEFGEITPAKIENAEGWKTEMKGIMEGVQCEGDVYAVSVDNTLAIFICASSVGTPPDTEKFIKSFRVRKEAVAEVQSDPAKMVDAVVSIAQANLPTRVDDVTTWTDIKVDHNAKSVVLVMTADGSAEDYGNMADVLEQLRPTLIKSLREGASSDLLISIPVSQGYAEGYEYYSSEDNQPLGTILISAEELK